MESERQRLLTTQRNINMKETSHLKDGDENHLILMMFERNALEKIQKHFGTNMIILPQRHG